MANDLINRRAAIEAMACLNPTEEWIHYDDIVNALKALPAAPRWIPVTERLPEENGRYLVSGGIKGSRQIWICEFVMMANVRGWINDVSNPIVLAWMPLLEPWKGEEDDND